MGNKNYDIGFKPNFNLAGEEGLVEAFPNGRGISWKFISKKGATILFRWNRTFFLRWRNLEDIKSAIEEAYNTLYPFRFP